MLLTFFKFKEKCILAEPLLWSVQICSSARSVCSEGVKPISRTGISRASILIAHFAVFMIQSQPTHSTPRKILYFYHYFINTEILTSRTPCPTTIYWIELEGIPGKNEAVKLKNDSICVPSLRQRQYCGWKFCETSVDLGEVSIGRLGRGRVVRLDDEVERHGLGARWATVRPDSRLLALFLYFSFVKYVVATYPTRWIAWPKKRDQ